MFSSHSFIYQVLEGQGNTKESLIHLYCNLTSTTQKCETLVSLSPIRHLQSLAVNTMSNNPIHGFNELSVQDSLLSPGNPIEMTNLYHSVAEWHSSEQKILPGSNVLKSDLRSKPRRDYWVWEFFGAVGSAVALIGIVIILRVFDGKRQPSWDGVSLNSIISWISTIAKVFILMPITSGLGQMKWVWFSGRKRPLSDLQIFDSASRGISGSATLLWRLKGP